MFYFTSGVLPVITTMKRIGQLKQAQYDANFERVVAAAEDCSKDGIECSDCPVYRNCLRWWDKSVADKPVTARRLPAMLSTMSRFRNMKHLPKQHKKTE